MSYSDGIDDQLDRFAMGQMPPDELALFQQKTKEDEALAADAIFRADKVQALRDIDLRNQLREEERALLGDDPLFFGFAWQSLPLPLLLCLFGDC